MTLGALQGSLLTSTELRRAYERLQGVPGLGPALHGVVRMLFPNDRDVVVRIRSGVAEGLAIRIDPRFHTEQGRGSHEPWVQQLLKELVRPGDAFCDVGAHIGFFTLCAARLVGDSGCVIALEPDPRNFQRLVRNVQLNRLHGVRTLKVAAWSRSGDLPFSPSPPASGCSEGAVTRPGRDHADTGPTRLSVRGVALDDLVGGQPSVIKVDVEGGETEVLRGARATLDRRRSTWLIEAHGHQRLTEVASLLAGSGYAPRVVRREASVGGQDRYFVVATP